MSLSVKAAMLASRDLRGTDRLVVLAIAAHCNQAGDAWPSVATIAEYVGVSERTVQRSLARLVQAGRLLVRRVAGIATRVYRLVVDGVSSAARRVTNPGSGVSDSAPGGDTQGDTQRGEERGEEKPRARARDWRNWIPRNKTQQQQRQPYPYPERRGAALPPPRQADQCPRHRGSLAHNCGPCRAERVEASRSPYAPPPAILVGGAR